MAAAQPDPLTSGHPDCPNQRHCQYCAVVPYDDPLMIVRETLATHGAGYVDEVMLGCCRPEPQDDGNNALCLAWSQDLDAALVDCTNPGDSGSANRYACYRTLFGKMREMQGRSVHVGAGQREPLPFCLLEHIRSRFPSLTGQYTGYRWTPAQLAEGKRQQHAAKLAAQAASDAAAAADAAPTAAPAAAAPAVAAAAAAPSGSDEDEDVTDDDDDADGDDGGGAASDEHESDVDDDNSDEETDDDDSDDDSDPGVSAVMQFTRRSARLSGRPVS
jgi:hypothetical protein